MAEVLLDERQHDLEEELDRLLGLLVARPPAEVGRGLDELHVGRRRVQVH